jgi:hypothetical protein
MSTTEKPDYDYELKVWLNRERTESATFFIRDVGPAEYMMAKDYIEGGKNIDGIYMLIKSLKVRGDDPAVITTNMVAFKSAEQLILQLLKPVEGELKKS